MSSIDHPPHYGGEDNVYEAIKVMRAWLTPQEYAGALKFNVFTYMQRHRDKNGLEDLQKGLWYLLELDRFVREVGYETIYPKAKAHPHALLTDEDFEGMGK